MPPLKTILKYVSQQKVLLTNTLDAHAYLVYIIVYTHVYPCIPMFTHVYPVYTHVYPCIPMFTQCILMFTQCILMHTHVYSVYTHVYPVYTHVYPCIPMFTQCTPMFTKCIPMYTQWILMYTHVYLVCTLWISPFVPQFTFLYATSSMWPMHITCILCLPVYLGYLNISLILCPKSCHISKTMHVKCWCL